jgi:hypothetical protein
MGRLYVVCEPCCRYVGVGGWLDGLDSRVVTFSCSICGRPGKLTFDDPAGSGLQYDLRVNPVRQPEVATRLQHMRHLANPFGRRPTVVRELLPQSERTKFVPEPQYRLKPMPFATFGDLAHANLVLEVWCSSCKNSRPVHIGKRFAGRVFGSVRFSCRGRRHDGEPCRGLGHPHIVPLQSADGSEAFVSLNCPRCVPPWSASPVHLDRPPWDAAPIDAGSERYRCTACGGQVRATFHGDARRAGVKGERRIGALALSSIGRAPSR